MTQHQALEEDATNLLLTTILTDWGLEQQSGGANYAIETEQSCRSSSQKSEGLQIK